MLKSRIIPCLDIKNGRVVKGVNFDNLIDAGDPVKQAKYYYDQGADELCFLDISATIEERSTILNIAREVAKVCYIPFTVGGGVKTIQDFDNLLRCGADKVSINSAAIKNPELVASAAKKYGSQCVVVAIDAKKNQEGDYEIYTHGGSKPCGINALKWAQEVQSLGAGEILLTSMDRDGTKAGFDLELTELIARNLTIPVIASGGVGNLNHLAQGLEAGASAVLAASIFHFRHYSIREAKELLRQKDIPVRI